MDLLKLTFMKPADEVVQLNNDILVRMQPLLYKVKLSYEEFPRFSVIYCLNSLTQSWKHSEKIEISEILARAVADHIIAHKEIELLRSLICEDFSYQNEPEINKIIRYCNQMLNNEDDSLYVADHGKNRRALTISNEIKQFFKKNNDLNLDGFLEFRLKEYKEELREVVEYAVDEFIMDKQYQEFIALLKYFVFIQEAKIPVVHLMHKGGHEFVLFNEQMTPMDLKATEDSFKIEILDQEFNFEDLVVSTLISIAPQEIHIHTREPEVQVIQTIMQIFENRVQICEYCRQCKPILGDRMIQNQHYT
ncbi:putative sporulation protein YtxC [Paenibacillus psychroresistens]|uniref:Putative sporulation protein YtxC n=1 Tax=Paenibacillus psychroresistens TaxID=1778678 RepID=A0A6B8RIN8_9BACL|nr:putative sporulation protein YtxC [Paenibacillus psychroresistens]QGQ95246.1 putative sporulation protein YtxC [Paenibacillus psychroresistens]